MIDPVLYLPFDEGSGSIAYDESGYSNNGAIYGGAAWVNGKLGRALSFDGVDDYIVVQDSPTLRLNSFTICVWINLKRIGTAFEWMLFKPYQTTWHGSISISLETSRGMVFRVYTGSIYAIDVYNFWLDGWHFYAFTRDKNTGEMKAYRDGQYLPPAGSSLGTGNILYDANPLYLPARWDKGWQLEYDELRIYNRVLSEAEIKWLYENSRARLGATPLMITDLNESSEPVGAEWHAWEEGQVVIKRYVYGIKRAWRLTCIEKDTAWSNSAARYLQQKMAAGETVTFTVSEGERYSLPPTTVHITGLELEMEPTGQQNIRKITATLKER